MPTPEEGPQVKITPIKAQDIRGASPDDECGDLCNGEESAEALTMHGVYAFDVNLGRGVHTLRQLKGPKVPHARHCRSCTG